MPPILPSSIQLNLPVHGSTLAPLVDMLFIDDKPGADDVLQISLTSLSESSQVFLKGNKKAPASSSNYHFSLQFNLGTLAGPGDIQLSDDSAGWSLCHVAASDGDWLYVVYTGASDLAIGVDPVSTTVTLVNVGGASKDGTRASLVKFNWNSAGWTSSGDNGGPSVYVHIGSSDSASASASPSTIQPVPGQDNKYASSLTMNLNIVNAGTGTQANPPLYATFVTPNTVVNDGTTANTLVLRVVNLGLSALSLGSNFKFVLFFDQDGTTVSKRWALGTTAQVNDVTMSAASESGGITWKVSATSSGAPKTWTITPSATTLASKDAIEIKIGSLVTGHPAGQTILHVQYENLPGYADGEIPVVIQKIPTHFSFSDTLSTKTNVPDKVGIGTSSPIHPLTVQTSDGYGIVHTDGDIKLATYVGNGKGEFGTESNHDLGFYTNDSSLQMVLKTDGKVGIGTQSPGYPLTLQTGDGNGLVHTDGTIKLATHVGNERGDVGTASNHNLGFYTNGGSARMVLTTGGHVGIGTQSPGYPLTVQTGTDANGIVHTDGTIRLATYVGYGRGDVGTESNHNLGFYTNGGHVQMVLTTDGRTGIGTETPTSTLDVNGSVNVSGAFAVTPGQAVTGVFPFQISRQHETNSFIATTNKEPGASDPVSITFDAAVDRAIVITTVVDAEYTDGDQHPIQRISYWAESTIDSSDASKVNVQFEARLFDATNHCMKVSFKFYVIAVLKKTVKSINPSSGG